MAISFREAEIQRQELITDSLGDEKTKQLEESIDRCIIKYHQKHRTGLFKKRIKIVASFYYNKCEDQETLINLINTGAISIFLERYIREGWSVRYYLDTENRPHLDFHKIISPQEELDEPSTLNTKKARLQNLKTQVMLAQSEIQRLEAEIQMLTESPNSRDPQLLPAHDI